jgi:hypothetical protein
VCDQVCNGILHRPAQPRPRRTVDHGRGPSSDSLESGLRYVVGAVAKTTRFSIGTTSRAAWPV